MEKKPPLPQSSAIEESTKSIAKKLSVSAKPLIPRKYYLSNAEIVISRKLPCKKVLNELLVDDEMLQVVCFDLEKNNFISSILVDGVKINWPLFSQIMAKAKTVFQLSLIDLQLSLSELLIIENIIKKLPDNSIVVISNIRLIGQDQAVFDGKQELLQNCFYKISRITNLIALQIDDELVATLNSNAELGSFAQIANIIQKNIGPLRKLLLRVRTLI